jgi:hypothetical protein
VELLENKGLRFESQHHRVRVELELEQLPDTTKLELVGSFQDWNKKFDIFLSIFGIFKNPNHHRLQTAWDENVITNDNILPRSKNVCDGLYEPLVKGLNVVVEP